MEKLNKDFKNMNINDDKKKKRNKKNKKDENKIEEQKEELTEEDIFKEELGKIKENLRELKIIFDQNKPKKYFEDKIDNYMLFEKLIDYNKIKQKILQIFNNQDIYSSLSNLWNKIIEYSKNKTNKKDQEITEEIEDSEEDSDKKKKKKKKILLYLFNKILMYLNFFTPKLINNTKDNLFKEEICETIFSNLELIKDIDDGDYFLYYFTEVFNIKDIFIKKFMNEHKEKTTNFILSYLVFGLNFINIFNLQETFPIEIIFKKISDNYYSISYLIYSLLSEAYIKNDPNKKYLVLDYIFKLLQEDKNCAQFNLVYELINKDLQFDNKKNDIIKKFMSLIRINLDKKLNKNTIDNAIYYSKIIFENKELFDEYEIDQTKKYICEYFNNLKENDWKYNLNRLDKFDYKDLKGYFDNYILIDYYNKLPLTKIESFAKILKFAPGKIRGLLKDLAKENLYNDGMRLIKMLKLSDEEIPLNYKEDKIKQFFHYKIKACEEENNPHNLIEYCLISQQTLDASIKKILNIYYKRDKYDYFYLYVINEIYYGAKDNKLKLSKKLKEEIEQIYYGIKYKDKYSFKDYFGPVTKDCLQIDKNKTNVVFIDDTIHFEEVLNKYFINSQYVGIDSEWQQNFKIIDETQVSIIQICNYDENCCILLDMIELSKKEKFFDLFEKYFKGKIFLGYYFDKSDLEVFPLRLKKFFEDKNNCTIYDLSIMAQQKFLEKGQSLKLLTEKIFGKSLCKYEQCSNWNKRPLSKCQIHYGALDALICVMIYKKLMEI